MAETIDMYDVHIVHTSNVSQAKNKILNKFSSPNPRSKVPERAVSRVAWRDDCNDDEIRCRKCKNKIKFEHGDRILCKCNTIMEYYGNGVTYWSYDASAPRVPELLDHSGPFQHPLFVFKSDCFTTGAVGNLQLTNFYSQGEKTLFHKSFEINCPMCSTRMFLACNHGSEMLCTCDFIIDFDSIEKKLRIRKNNNTIESYLGLPKYDLQTMRIVHMPNNTFGICYPSS